MRSQPHAHHSVHVEVRGQLAGLAFYILVSGPADFLGDSPASATHLTVGVLGLQRPRTWQFL